MPTRSDRDNAAVTGGKPPNGPCFVDHPLRSALINEIHARPFAALEPPVQASHLALVSGEHGATEDFAHLVRLCERYGLSSPTEGSKHFTCDFGTFRLKWERHGEFCTYTFFCRNPTEQPFSIPAILHVPRDWLEALPGKLLVAVHIAVEPHNRPYPFCGRSGSDFSIRDSFWQSCFRRCGPSVDRLCSTWGRVRSDLNSRHCSRSIRGRTAGATSSGN